MSSIVRQSATCFVRKEELELNTLPKAEESATLLNSITYGEDRLCGGGQGQLKIKITTQVLSDFPD